MFGVEGDGTRPPTLPHCRRSRRSTERVPVNRPNQPRITVPDCGCSRRPRPCAAANARRKDPEPESLRVVTTNATMNAPLFVLKDDRAVGTQSKYASAKI